MNKQHSYVIQLKNAHQHEHDLVGTEATIWSQFMTHGVNFPESFVITSPTFDDFITAADIVEKIATALAWVQPDNWDSAERATQEIQKVINQANFPSIIINPILQAYRSLSGMNEKYLNIYPSWVFSVDDGVIPAKLTYQDKMQNVRGEASLLFAVKQCWLELFTAEALLLRANQGYIGGISLAIIVQRALSGEVTGTAVSDVYEVEESEASIEVNAQLGLWQGDLNPHRDVYRYAVAEERILEKTIVSQPEMMVHRGRSSGTTEPLLMIPVSAEWQRHQKLSDQAIGEIAQVSATVAEGMEQDVQINWTYDGGLVYVTNIEELPDQELIFDNLQGHADREIRALKIIDTKATIERKEVDIKALADEVTAMAASLDEEVVLPEVETSVLLGSTPIAISERALEPVVEEAVIEDVDSYFNLNTELYLDISQLDSAALTAAKKYDGAYFNATEMVLRHHILPETVAKDPREMQSLIDAYALELANAAKVIEPRPLYYSFSDIGDWEREQMGVNTPGALDGTERLVTDINAVLPEILAIKRARKEYLARNIKLIMPKLRSEPELISIKQIIAHNGLQRSNVLQLLGEISTPAFLYELNNLLPSDLDGLLINLPKLANALVQRSQTIERDMHSALSAVKMAVDFNRKKNFSLLVYTPNNPAVLERMFKESIQPRAFIFARPVDQEMLAKITQLESQYLLVPRIKRSGRPTKAL